MILKRCNEHCNGIVEYKKQVTENGGWVGGRGFVWVHAHVHACVSVLVFVCVHACVCACMHVYSCVRAYMWLLFRYLSPVV